MKFCFQLSDFGIQSIGSLLTLLSLHGFSYYPLCSQLNWDVLFYFKSLFISFQVNQRILNSNELKDAEQQQQINLQQAQRIMFNPQRKSKVSDIYMQQKWYQMHAKKIRQITASSSPQKQRQRQQQQQERYLKRLSLSKKQVQQRVNSNIKNSNHKLFMKLLDTDNRKQDNPEAEYFKNRKKHFNSYYSSKREIERVKEENFTMVTRMMNSSSEVPTLLDCKQEFKKVKRFEKKCRKLPAIFQHQQDYRQKFSKRYLLDESQARSRIKSSRFSHLRLEETNNIGEREKELLSKQLSKYDLTIGEKEQDKSLEKK